MKKQLPWLKEGRDTNDSYKYKLLTDCSIAQGEEAFAFVSLVAHCLPLLLAFVSPHVGGERDASPTEEKNCKRPPANDAATHVIVARAHMVLLSRVSRPRVPYLVVNHATHTHSPWLLFVELQIRSGQFDEQRQSDVVSPLIIDRANDADCRSQVNQTKKRAHTHTHNAPVQVPAFLRQFSQESRSLCFCLSKYMVPFTIPTAGTAERQSVTQASITPAPNVFRSPKDAV